MQHDVGNPCSKHRGQLCETLKSKGITPVAFGLKDSYLSCFLPWQIAPTVIYAKNLPEEGGLHPRRPGNRRPADGRAVRQGPGGHGSTGNWSIGVARAANPNLDPGFFCFPANAPGEELWITNTIGEAMSVAKGSKNVAAAKTALAMFTDKAYARPWTDRARSISTIVGVNNNFDPALKDFGAYLAAHKSWQFTNYGWPAGVSDV